MNPWLNGRKKNILPVLLCLSLCLSDAGDGLAAQATAPDAGRATTPATSAETAALRRLLNLKLVDARHKEIHLAQWQGRVRVINFWATWCGPCKEEMPAFSRLQDRFQSQGVQFVGIAVDSAANVLKFTGKTPVSYPLPIGGDDVLALSRELGNAYMSLPFTLVVDKKGQILARKLGRFSEEELAVLLRQQIKTKR
jgi:thiol-disulfide isomerase/thioredoxin